MASLPARLSFATSGDAACYRVIGKPSLDLSNLLHDSAERLLATGHYHFVVDLAACPSVDSTFIGVLLFIWKGVRKVAAPGGVCLMNAGELVRHQLDSLGVLERFDLATVDQAGVHFEELDVASAGKTATTWLCLTAHRELIEANPANAAKFKDVVEFLEEEAVRQAKPPGN